MKKKQSAKLSKRNQRGLWVLVAVLFCVIITPRFLTIFKESEPLEVSSTELDIYMDEINKNVEKRKFEQKKNYSYSKKTKFKRPKSKFNPNNYSSEDWRSLGLSEKQSAVVLKFTSRGIYSNEELKQVFVISEELFNLLKDSTYYPEKPKSSYEPKDRGVQKKSAKIVDLNTASQEDFESLKGIGPFYAKKIVEYREQLGGYISEDQLLEIWKFDQDKLAELKPSIILSNTKLKKLNINKATAEELKAHPYITWNVANSIVKMRTKFNKYSNFEQLLESELIDKQLLKKIQPYLTLE